jgi:hypothetical protein
MNVEKLQASLIRAFWTVVLPLIGLAVERLYEWWSTSGNPESIGVESSVIALAIGAILYAAKKYKWPETKW